MARKIKALRRIVDGGHNIRRNETREVADGYAVEWIARGWAEPVSDAPKLLPKDKAE